MASIMTAHWEFFDLETGVLLKEGTQSLNVPSNRLTGPGVNNDLIAKLRKGRTVELEFPSINLRVVYTPGGLCVQK